MFALEIIHQIKKPNIGSNFIIKLDMKKAYDIVSQAYICFVLRKMGFDENFIDMVWRVMPSNWYSIIINGKSMISATRQEGSNQEIYCHLPYLF